MRLSLRHLLLLLLLPSHPHTSMGPRAGEAAAAATPGTIRVKAAGFEVSEEYVAAVCLSAIGELQRHCPELPAENVVIEHGGAKGHAIVLYDRNPQGEVVIQLDTSKTYWSQYAYQVAHEITHAHCGFRRGPTQNLWFEETVCEAASLFCLRAMARTWQTQPPYPRWVDYAPSSTEYADDAMANNADKAELLSKGLARFYRDHEQELHANATARELNGAIALALLPFLEEAPGRWAAFRWLNATPRPEQETFAAFLQRWEDNTPAEEHKTTVQGVRGLFGF